MADFTRKEVLGGLALWAFMLAWVLLLPIGILALTEIDVSLPAPIADTLRWIGLIVATLIGGVVIWGIVTASRR